MERWKQVVGFEGLYEVSDNGRVRTVKTGRIKKPTVDKIDGRHFLLLWRDNKCYGTRVSRLVLLAFRGPPPSGHEGCHNDGNNDNNRLSNLRWDTPSENQRDRAKHGTSNRGERCAAAKLTEKQVLEMISCGNKTKRISSQLALSEKTIETYYKRIKNKYGINGLETLRNIARA